MNPRDSLLRKIIGGKYHIEALIGRGGCGEVYRATQFPVERAVAIKVIRPSSDIELAPVRQRFFLEARVLARLTDPSTVTLFDYGEEGDGLLYMVQEFVEGHTLDVVLRREGRLAPHRVVSIGAQLLHSLAEAHGFDIVHRDIKPTNIMVTVGRYGADTTKLLDFGIAKILEAGQGLVTRPGMVVGTPVYIAPEQASELPVGPATDLYSLGVVLYHMLSGQPPFNGATVIELLMQHVREIPPPLPADVPPRLAAVTMRALAKRPEDRFSSAAEMREALEAALEGPGADRAPWPRPLPGLRRPAPGDRPPAEQPEPARASSERSRSTPPEAPVVEESDRTIVASTWRGSWVGTRRITWGVLGLSAALLGALGLALAFWPAVPAVTAVDGGPADVGVVDAAGLDEGHPVDAVTPDATLRDAIVDARDVRDASPPDAAAERPDASVVDRLEQRIQRDLARCECPRVERALKRMERLNKRKHRQWHDKWRRECKGLSGACFMR